MNIIFYLIFLWLCPLMSYAESHQPQLIVQIVVDQLRGDLIQQHSKQFGDTGFNYLLNHSLNYYNTHHPHANTTTCAGHATIATGSYPSMHGVVDNDWYDRHSHRLIYCMEDLNTKVLPTEHTRTIIQGRSPHNLNASTLSDEMILANKGKAFAVSLKDRSAITLAGHAGKAFWFDKTNGGFVTSDYYYSNYPSWVQNWNKSYHPKTFTWSLSQPLNEYQNKNTPTFHHNFRAFGQNFPHLVENPPSEEYFKFLAKTPKADQLTADFAEQLLINERLGVTENKTDYLAISFSAVDAIGHQFGPHSLEAEDNLLQLDKTLSHLLAVIDKRVGLNNTLIVLTADHGVSDNPAFLKVHHIAEIKPLDTVRLKQHIQTQLNRHYPLMDHALLEINPPFIYLDHQKIIEHKLSVNKVSEYIVELLNQQPGIFKAYTLPVANMEKDWISQKVAKMYYPYRAGDIYMIPPPYQSLGAKSEDRVAHGSPWQYDSYVPLLFVHPNFKPTSISRAVYTTDIAITLSTLLMIKSPSAAVGQPLSEVIKAFNTE